MKLFEANIGYALNHSLVSPTAKETLEKFNKEINDWIRSRNDIKISRITQSEAALESGVWRHTKILISIFYDIVDDSSQKESTRIKIFSSLAEELGLEQAYEAWVAGHPKESVSMVGEGIKITRKAIAIKDIIQTQSGGEGYLNHSTTSTTITVVYYDFFGVTDKEDSKTKKGPPPIIVLPKRKEKKDG